MFVGYLNNTSADTFWMLSLDTNHIIKRVILLLNETIGTYQQTRSNETSEILVPPSPALESTAPAKVKTETIAPIPCAVCELDTFYNPSLDPVSQPGRDIVAETDFGNLDNFDDSNNVRRRRSLRNFPPNLPPTPIAIDRGDQRSLVFDLEEPTGGSLSQNAELTALLLD